MNLKREIKKIIRETLTETIKGESEGQETTEPTEKPKRKRKQPYKSNKPHKRLGISKEEYEIIDLVKLITASYNQEGDQITRDIVKGYKIKLKELLEVYPKYKVLLADNASYRDLLASLDKL